jgi:4-amino-4-deoxy-L-arabinose transferase-like glycosyltransferase
VVVAFGAVIFHGTLTHDFRSRLLVGDAAAHLMQALSLAYDSHTLNFDAKDLARWQQVGWEPLPRGLYVQRYGNDRWAAAKPYGYSLYLAPFIAVFGAVPGLAIANSMLLLLLVAIAIALVRTRFEGPVVPLLVASFFLASYAYIYAYIAHTELFLALLTLLAFGALLRYRDTGRLWWAIAGFAVIGFSIAERMPFLPLFAPLAAYTLWRAPSTKARLTLVGVGVLVFAVAVLPYLRYSDWQSITPYGGERYYVVDVPPFAGGQNYTSAEFEVQGVGETLWGPIDDKLTAAGLYFVGRHTGMLAFIPVAFLLLAAVLARIRSLDRWTLAALLGVVAYIAFFVVLYPGNYYGGGQSLGNRYFLQAAPAVLIVAVLATLPRRWLVWSSGVGILLGVTMLWPHHLHPGIAYDTLAKTSPLQRALPFERNLDYPDYFICSEPDCR